MIYILLDTLAYSCILSDTLAHVCVFLGYSYILMCILGQSSIFCTLQLAITCKTDPGGAVGKAKAPCDLLKPARTTSTTRGTNFTYACSGVKGEDTRGEECLVGRGEER